MNYSLFLFDLENKFLWFVFLGEFIFIINRIFNFLRVLGDGIGFVF